MNVTIPCDTLVRLASLIMPVMDTLEPEFQCIRLDNGQVLASDRCILSVYNILPRFSGIAYIKPDVELIEQCRKEALYNGTLDIVVTDMVQYTVAKTKMGYISGNIGFWPAPGSATDYDRWRIVIAEAVAKGQAKNSGGMFWHGDKISRLVNSAPSGCAVFSENIDVEWPTLLRDQIDHNWLGCFNPKSHPVTDGPMPPPATLPEWMR